MPSEPHIRANGSDAEEEPLVLVLNETRKTLLASRLRVLRAPGLRAVSVSDPILPGDGLWIESGNQVDTTRMAVSLDLVFLDADHRVVESITAVGPGAVTPEVAKAAGVLELPAGTIPSTQTQIGDRILIEAINSGGERSPD
jgi:hypothetical protein